MTAAVRSAGPITPGDIGEMCSSAMHAWFEDPGVLTDELALLTAMRDAAAAGHATVLGQTSAVFPNGAVSAVLLLSESHLAVHTWPERGQAHFDLLTCGRLSADLIFEHLRSALAPVRSNTVQTTHDLT
jgi:S-adenosylmethionine decarboxylase